MVRQAGWIPTDGRSDLESRTIRAVGNPVVRFDEDALRLLRAARFAAQLGFDIDPATKAAMAGAADTATFVSNERVGGELQRIIAADPPSTAFGILAETGVLHHALPELAAQIGVPQDKVTGHDLWGHCLATVDGAAVVDPTKDLLRVAALLHDIGKPPTFADGHFIGHDEVGASMAERTAHPARVSAARCRAMSRSSSETTCSATSGAGRGRPCGDSSVAWVATSLTT